VPGSPARVMSFSYTALQRMRRLAPDLPLVMLIEKKRHWPMLQGVIGDGWILGPGIDLLRESPSFARRLADTGRDLHVWTVNTAEDLEVCLEHGVKAVITDRPGMMLDLLDSGEAAGY
jgi:glycerophosphoryl diester phosphodiesterase